MITTVDAVVLGIPSVEWRYRGKTETDYRVRMPDSEDPEGGYLVTIYKHGQAVDSRCPCNGPARECPHVVWAVYAWMQEQAHDEVQRRLREAGR